LDFKNDWNEKSRLIAFMTEVFIQAKTIVAKLVRAGYTAYFAGGWVRDFVMGHPSEDIDIATDASPAEIMDLFPNTILVGLAFGVVIVVMEGHQFEVATFRKDLRYLDGRHPQGIEMSTPLEDALRRDFTINGMFYDPLEEVIHDYVHGREDIRLGIVRTIGDPYERFFEDRLRMLRAFRFSARFSFAIDPETQEAIRQNADKLFPAVAMERVWQEFNKMVAYPRFDQALVEMHRLTLLDVIFPEMVGMHIKDLRQKVHNFSYFPAGCPTIVYLMEILSTLSFDQRIEIAKRIKASNKDIKLLEFMEMITQEVLQEQSTHHIDLHRWTKLLAHPDWELCIKVLSARYAHHEWEKFWQTYYERYQKLEPHIQRLRMGKPLISAAILQERGVKPGKHMGQLLKEAERIAINENLHEPETLLAKLVTSPLWKAE
jgi:poly(A) polymerase